MAKVSRKPVWRTQRQTACRRLTERSGYRSLKPQGQDKAQDKGVDLRGLVMDTPGDSRCPVTRMLPLMQN